MSSVIASEGGVEGGGAPIEPEPRPMTVTPLSPPVQPLKPLLAAPLPLPPLQTFARRTRMPSSVEKPGMLWPLKLWMAHSASKIIIHNFRVSMTISNYHTIHVSKTISNYYVACSRVLNSTKANESCGQGNGDLTVTCVIPGHWYSLARAVQKALRSVLWRRFPIHTSVVDC